MRVEIGDKGTKFSKFHCPVIDSYAGVVSGEPMAVRLRCLSTAIWIRHVQHHGRPGCTSGQILYTILGEGSYQDFSKTPLSYDSIRKKCMSTSMVRFMALGCKYCKPIWT